MKVTVLCTPRTMNYELCVVRFLCCFSICHLQPRQDNSPLYLQRHRTTASGVCKTWTSDQWDMYLYTGQLLALTGNSISCAWYNETQFTYTKKSLPNTVTSSVSYKFNRQGKKIKWFNNNSNLHKPLKPDINTHSSFSLFQYCSCQCISLGWLPLCNTCLLKEVRQLALWKVIFQSKMRQLSLQKGPPDSLVTKIIYHVRVKWSSNHFFIT